MKTDTAVVQEVVEYYRSQGRHDMPWRQVEPDGSHNPYKILVSEIMLQQTQVARVIEKYHAFLAAFPTVEHLATARLEQVLMLWVGLGYNRRARYLHEAAKILAKVPEPWTHEDLVVQKGIGPNTAAAVVTYAYDLPQVFIETNVRSVIIHHYFSDQELVSDVQIMAVLQRLNNVAFTVISPREWYWALMDYGTHIKATHGNASRKSKGYKIQSKFDGSRRQIRGKIIRLLTDGRKTYDEAKKLIDDERFDDVLAVLEREKLVKLSNNMLMLYNE